jgi:hypothetical protein
MDRKERTRYHLAIFVLLTALVFTLIGFQVASAVVDAGNGATNACYNTRNGKLRAAVTPCKSSESARVLGAPNQVPLSYASTSVIPVTLGSDDTTVVATGIAASGTYVVTANTSLYGSQACCGFVVTICHLQSSTGSVGVESRDTVTGGDVQTVALTSRLTVTSAGQQVALKCTGGDLVQANVLGLWGSSITAVKVG